MLFQVTEKSESYMDNLQVALEQWERQLGLGAEVEAWAAAKLAVFAESHPFHSEQQVLDMRVRTPQTHRRTHTHTHTQTHTYRCLRTQTRTRQKHRNK